MTLGLIQIQSLSKLMAQKLQLHSQKQQSPVVTSVPTLQEQHWQMARILFQLKHLILMETLQQQLGKLGNDVQAGLNVLYDRQREASTHVPHLDANDYPES